MDAAKRILAKQQEREAWSVTLQHDEWVEGLRRLINADSPCPQELIRHFECGPSLGVLYGERLRELRALPAEGMRAWIERLQPLLSPSFAYITQWQARAQKEESFRKTTLALEVDAHLWRSPQPRREALLELKQRGLTWVCNLRQESRESERLSQEVGLDYHHIPVVDMGLPQPAQITEFLNSFRGREGSGLVHCFAGQGRTGIFVACYRIFNGMSRERAVDLTDSEIHSRGMRPHQREWVLNLSEELFRGG